MLRHTGKHNAPVSGNSLCKRRSPVRCGRSVLTLTPARNHKRVKNASRHRIGNYALESVADFNSQAVTTPFPNGAKKKNSVVLVFLPDTPARKKPVGKIVNLSAFERFQRHHGHLRTGFLLQLCQKFLRRRAIGRIHHIGEIADMACRFERIQ